MMKAGSVRESASDGRILREHPPPNMKSMYLVVPFLVRGHFSSWYEAVAEGFI